MQWQLQVKIPDTKDTCYNGICLGTEQFIRFWSGEKRKEKKKKPKALELWETISTKAVS